MKTALGLISSSILMFGGIWFYPLVCHYSERHEIRFAAIITAVIIFVIGLGIGIFTLDKAMSKDTAQRKDI